MTIMLALIFGSAARADEYKVNVGDVLELSAAGVPDFRHRSTVDSGGEISFPLAGTIAARDKSVKDILKVVQERMPQKALRQREPDGSTHDIIIDSDEISLSVVEYSPVFLTGDVSNPGSYPYRPGLTVRQAVALAGGYDILRTRMENPYLLTPDLRSQREILLNDYARQQARIARIQEELGEGVKLANVQPTSPAAPEIQSLEAEQLDARKADFEKERQYLTDSVKSLSTNVTLLEKQLQTEADRAKIDQEDMSRVEGLVEKGMAPVTRLSDTRRLVLLSASRATEIEARAELVRQQRAEQARKLQRLFDDRRLELLKELQDAKVELAATESRLSAATEKLFLVGMVRSQISRGQAGAPGLTIIRRSGSSSVRMGATEDTELLPRDVIEVALQVDGNPVGYLRQPATSDIRPTPQAREHLGALPSPTQAQ